MPIPRRQLAPCYTETEDVRHTFSDLEVTIFELPGLLLIAELYVRGEVGPDTPEEGRYSPGQDGSVRVEFTEVKNCFMYALGNGAQVELDDKIVSILWERFGDEIEQAAIVAAGDIDRVLYEKARGY